MAEGYHSGLPPEAAPTFRQPATVNRAVTEARPKHERRERTPAASPQPPATPGRTVGLPFSHRSAPFTRGSDERDFQESFHEPAGIGQGHGGSLRWTHRPGTLYSRPAAGRFVY